MKAQPLNAERVTASVRTGTDPTTRDAGEIYLMAGGLLRLDIRRPGGNIICLHGECWVTQEGNYADYRLIPGETFPVSRRGRLIVQAMRDGAKVRVS